MHAHPIVLFASLAALAAPLPAAPLDPVPNGKWPYFFPIWGQAAVDRGADIPLPAGLSVNALWQRDDIKISDAFLGLGTRDLVPLDFAKLGRIRNDAYMVVGRFDLWVLPMLDAYAVGGPIWTKTDVVVKEPYQVEIKADAHGFNGGFGGVGAVGNRFGFALIDTNVTWTYLNILDRPEVAFMIDPRLGHRFDPIAGWTLAVWVGGTYQTFVSRSVGSVPMGSFDFLALQPDLNYVNTLSPTQQQHFSQIVTQGTQAAMTPGSRIYFDLQVKPVEAWSMNAGFQAQMRKDFVLMAEGNFLGSRASLLLSAAYRFGI